jgi:hypothetical protein
LAGFDAGISGNDAEKQRIVPACWSNMEIREFEE